MMKINSSFVIMKLKLSLQLIRIVFFIIDLKQLKNCICRQMLRDENGIHLDPLRE